MRLLAEVLAAGLLAGFIWEGAAALLGSRGFHLDDAFRNAAIAGLALVIANGGDLARSRDD